MFKNPILWIVFGLIVAFVSVPLRFLGSITPSPASVSEMTPTVESPGLSLRLVPANPSWNETRVTAEVKRAPSRTTSPETIAVLSSSPEWIEIERPTVEFAAHQSHTSFGITLRKADHAYEQEKPKLATIVATSSQGTASSTLKWGNPVPESDKHFAADQVFPKAADTFAFASVILLTGACLVFFRHEANPSATGSLPGRIPISLRLACLLSIAIALPSSVSNAIRSSEPFWSCITLSLLAISFMLVCGYRLGDWTVNFTKHFREQHIFRIITLLTISGALGGLAFHIVTNQSRIEFPSVTYLGIAVAKKTPPPTSVDDKARAVPTAYPDFDKSLLLAEDQREAFEKSRNSRDPAIIGVITALFAGVFGDILVGIIAANAVHLLVSGLIYHDETASDSRAPGDSQYRRYLTRQNLTVISLGILAGFAGPKLLPDWANNLFEKTKKDLQQQIDKIPENLQDRIDQQLTMGSEAAAAPNPQQHSEIEKQSESLIESIIRPFVFLLDVEQDGASRVAEFIPKSESITQNVPSALTVVRIYNSLFVKGAVGSPQQAYGDASAVLSTMPESEHKNLARLIIGRFLLRNRDHPIASELFKEVAGTPEFKDYRTLAQLHLVWLLGPSDQSYVDFLVEPDQLDTETARSLFDHIRITRSLVLASSASASEESRSTANPDHFAKIVFHASALYIPERWRFNHDIRQLAPGDVSQAWKNAENRVIANLLDLNKIVNPEGNINMNIELNKQRSVPLQKYLESATEDWSPDTARRKSQQVINVLRPNRQTPISTPNN